MLIRKLFFFYKPIFSILFVLIFGSLPETEPNSTVTGETVDFFIKNPYIIIATEIFLFLALIHTEKDS